MNGKEWEREAVSRYSGAVMSVLADGGWHSHDAIEATVLPEGSSFHDGLTLALCMDVLAIARREVDMRKVERDGYLTGFEYRLHGDEPVQIMHTLEDFA